MILIHTINKIRFHSFPKDEKLKKKRGVTSQESQVSGLRENLVLSMSVQNILKTNTFANES